MPVYCINYINQKRKKLCNYKILLTLTISSHAMSKNTKQQKKCTLICAGKVQTQEPLKVTELEKQDHA